MQSFIDADLWDEARIFKGESLLKQGVKAPELKGTLISAQNILEDQLSIFKR